jgi:hypothetical protein
MDSLFALPVKLNKDTTGLLYKFWVSTSAGQTILEKDLDVINLVAGDRQLTLTNSTVENDYEVLDSGDCYNYEIIECETVTEQATRLFSGRLDLLPSITSC